jgi:ribonuclease R
VVAAAGPRLPRRTGAGDRHRDHPAGLRIRLPRLGITGFVTAERALDLPARERGRLEVDEHGLSTSSGPWRVGSRVEVRFVGLDDTGRANWRLGPTGG